MKFFGQLYGQAKTPAERQIIRVQATDMVRIRGTAQKPPAPREVTVQSAPRGIFISWSLPDPRNPLTKSVTGWRIYKDDEKTLYGSIQDTAIRQFFVEATAGSAPPVVNVFISAVNNLGAESEKVQAQGTASIESGAPTMPSSPTGYTGTYSGGGGTACFSGAVEIETDKGLVRFDQLPNPCWIVNPFGKFEAEVIRHEDRESRVIELAADKYVTENHLMLANRWVQAWTFYRVQPRIKYRGPLFNLHVKTDFPDAQCYRLFNGDVAHNMKSAQL